MHHAPLGMEKQYEGMKKAIVVGASSGIGMEVARLLLKQGWKVGVAARRIDLLKTIGDVETEQIDVTKPEATQQLQHLIERVGGMDLFFYASGIGKQNRELKENIELATVETNAVGFTRMIGEAYRYFAQQGHGHIAAISSIAGTKGLGPAPSYSATHGHIAAISSIAGTKGLGPAPSYSATKALQNVYLQALEQQANARDLDICFTDIRPGFVDTALLNGNFKYPMMLKPEAVAQDIVENSMFASSIGNTAS